MLHQNVAVGCFVFGGTWYLFSVFRIILLWRFHYFHYFLKANTKIMPNNVTQPNSVHFLRNCISAISFSWRYGTTHPNGTVQAAFSLDMEGCSIRRLRDFQWFLSFFRVIISEIISNVHEIYFQWLQSCGFFLCCLGAHQRAIADVCVNMGNQPPKAVK
jgi:hypothetical protein